MTRSLRATLWGLFAAAVLATCSATLLPASPRADYDLHLRDLP